MTKFTRRVFQHQFDLTIGASSSNEFFPPKPPITRKPYISSDTISLIAQLPHTSSTELKPLRNKIEKPSKLDKKKVDLLQPPCWLQWLLLRTLAYHQKGTIQISTLYSVSQPSGWHTMHQIQEFQALVLAQHLKNNVWNSLLLPDPSKSLWLLLDLMWILLSPCLNYTEPFVEQKQDELQVPTIYLWKLFVSSPIPPNAFFFLTLLNASSQEQRQTIGSQVKLSGHDIQSASKE